LEQENANLTNLKNLIIDEAHNIEDTVTESLKKTYSLKIFREYFEKFEKIFNLKNIKQIDFINKKNSLFSTLEVLDDYSISYLNNAVKEDNPYKTTLIKNNYFENLKCEDFVKKLNLDFLNIIDNLEVINEYDFSKEINFITEIAKFVNVFFDKNNLDKYIKIISFSEN
jgi:Rad3-related DNA helicase